MDKKYYFDYTYFGVKYFSENILKPCALFNFFIYSIQNKVT